MKCATVSLIGRPSAGKSTLVNTICEMKVSITAKTPQTTRNAIRGIYTDSRGQLIFTDTPGFHLSDKNFNKRMQDVTLGALDESDTILYVIDASREAEAEEIAIATILQKAKSPVIVVINKKDILSDNQIEKAKEFVTTYLPNAPLLTASGGKDGGADEILIEVFKTAPEGELR